LAVDALAALIIFTVMHIVLATPAIPARNRQVKVVNPVGANVQPDPFVTIGTMGAVRMPI